MNIGLSTSFSGSPWTLDWILEKKIVKKIYFHRFFDRFFRDLFIKLKIGQLWSTLGLYCTVNKTMTNFLLVTIQEPLTGSDAQRNLGYPKLT